MRVFVTGGTGYVGQRVVDALSNAGHAVTILTRPNSKRAVRRPNLQIVEGGLFDHERLLEGMKQADAVVHLVGIIRERRSQGITMQRIHVDGTEAVLRAARESGISRIVHMSALGARERATSKYHQSKFAAEEAVRRSGLRYTIFRPSVVFGRGGPGPEFVGQLTDLVRKAPFTPVIGDGQSLLQPVSIQTVAEVFEQALTLAESEFQTFEVGGPDVVSYESILRQIAEHLNKPFRPVHIPMRFMRMMVRLFERFPAFPLTTDQLAMLTEGNVCEDPARLYNTFGVKKIPFRVD